MHEFHFPINKGGNVEISISISQSTELNQHKVFTKAKFDDLSDIVNTVCNFVWSPIVWAHGNRKSVNYLFSDFAVLDFDDGRWSVDDAIEFCKDEDVAGIIGTTKSHQKPKNNLPACDRFRLIMPWSHRLVHLDTYRQNMKRIASHFPCDQQCTDGARMYQPCTEIVFIKQGEGLDWHPYEEPKKHIRYEPTVYEQTGILPRWLEAMLVESPAPGTRNKHAFRLAAKLAEHGFSEQQVVERVLAAPIDLSTQEKKDAARSGYRAGRRF